MNFEVLSSAIMEGKTIRFSPVSYEEAVFKETVFSIQLKQARFPEDLKKHVESQVEFGASQAIMNYLKEHSRGMYMPMVEKAWETHVEVHEEVYTVKVYFVELIAL